MSKRKIRGKKVEDLRRDNEQNRKDKIRKA